MFECRPRRRALGTCTEEHFPIRGRLANGLGVLHGTQELLSLSSTTSLSLNGNGAGNKKQLPYLFHLLRVDGNGDVANDLLFLKKNPIPSKFLAIKKKRGGNVLTWPSNLAMSAGGVKRIAECWIRSQRQGTIDRVDGGGRKKIRRRRNGADERERSESNQESSILGADGVCK